MKKERIDVLLVNKGFFETREKAKRSIMAGLVFVKDERVDKPGARVDVEAPLRVKGDTMPYVSRGGLKLEKAIKSFHLDFKDKTVLDIGASTGGFTDCAIQHGADFVYSCDVGYNQLAWSLRNHEKVEVMERMNFRYAVKDDFQKGLPDIAVADVSFISLKWIVPPLYSIFGETGEAMLLVKPQFEAGRGKVGKKGIVRDPAVHLEVLENTTAMASAAGFVCRDISYSPITGGEGNIEFLLYLQKGMHKEKELPKDALTQIVEKAHTSFLS